jgi:F0F1-type ATP synthase membrane subunit a
MTDVIPRGSGGVYLPAMPPTSDLDNATEPVPLGQRLFDNVFLLLAAGIVVMLVLYTAWGLWEITTLPPAQLP